jgi:hypothetical protein
MPPGYRRGNEEREMSRFGRGIAVGVTVAAATGCKEGTGLNVPLEEARAATWHHTWYDAAPAPTEPGRLIELDGRRWMSYDAPHREFGPNYGVRIPAAKMRPSARASASAAKETEKKLDEFPKRVGRGTCRTRARRAKVAFVASAT